MPKPMAPSIPKTSFHVTFSGRVQGVGFRFTAQRFANDLALVGWVRNLPDGDVELYVQGDPAACQELLQRLEKYFSITRASASEGPASGVYTSFEIKY